MPRIEWDNLKIIEETPDQDSVTKETEEVNKERMEIITAILLRAFKRSVAAQAESESREAA